MNYKKGIPIARIITNGLDKVLKFDTREPEVDVNSSDSIERFGHKKPMLSLFERILNLNEEELAAVLNTDPTLKKRIKNEIKNEKVPPHFIPVRSKNPDREGWEQHVEIPGARFIPTVNPKDFRDIVYIYGSSGSGKSSVCRAYVDEYRKEFPNNKVYLFSLKPSDVTLEDKGLIRIPNTLSVLQGIDVDTLENSLTIFDDCDGFDTKATPETREIYRIQDNIAQIARDRRVSCIITTHLACKGDRTKIILTEATKFIVFPKFVPRRNFRYLMKEYANLDPVMINKALKLESRWVCVNKNYPSYMLYETGCYTTV